MDTETIMNFLADNYKWFMVGAGVLLLALVGFAVGGRKKKENNDNGVMMNQADFNQMGTMQQAQAAGATPQFIQNQAPAAAPQTPVAAAPVAAVPAPVQPAPAGETIFTGEPVNTNEPEPEEEKLVIEAPTGTLNENINMDTIGSENKQELLPPEAVTPVAPATQNANQIVFETPSVEAPAEAPVMETLAPEMAAAPAPAVEAQPVMTSVAQDTDIPISMTPEEPVMQTPPTPVAQEVAPAPVAPATPAAPMYQNTIQQ